MKMKIKSNDVCLMFLLFLFWFLYSPTQAKPKSYVVFMGSHSHESQPSELVANRITNSYHKLLGSIMERIRQEKQYSTPTHTTSKGFAAVLDDDHVHQLSKHSNVISVFPDKKNELYTTRSWEFLGLESNGITMPTSLWNKTNYGEDMIIGVVDTGVWPEHASFNDDGMGPVPSTWNMTANCNTNDSVSCNNKLIGAKYYNKGFLAAYNLSYPPLNPSYETARDTDGHGTHCLSIAAGSFVPDAHFLGSATGTAKGGSPNARVVSYKVFWDEGGFDSDILAAMEDAIKDHVDILSLSLGSDNPQDYFNDSKAIGAFLATREGIPVLFAAGNSGPQIGSVENFAPWITTVAASTIDRTFPSAAILGNGLKFEGVSFNTNNQSSQMVYPLIYALDAKNPNADDDIARLCYSGSLDPSKVDKKIVYCDPGFPSDVEKSFTVFRAGGKGMIVSSGRLPDTDAYCLPTAVICLEDGPSVLKYITDTQSPTASITGSTQVGNPDAPAVALFSSRGPNPITPEILKPDITAPGVNILAAFSLKSPPSHYDGDDRHFPFKIMSGTSMACPHVAAIAALLKKLHPKWSPAALRSAMMTTAKYTTRGDFMLDQKYDYATPFDRGSGHIMPNNADDPGLVYDLNFNDYLDFMCSIDYDSRIIKTAFNQSYNCPSTKPDVLNFNYPSIVVPKLGYQQTVVRKLKNVGNPGTYKAFAYYPWQISIIVDPPSLTFNNLNEEKSFNVTITVQQPYRRYCFGRIVWYDGVHVVTSQVVVKQG